MGCVFFSAVKVSSIIFFTHLNLCRNPLPRKVNTKFSTSFEDTEEGKHLFLFVCSPPKSYLCLILASVCPLCPYFLLVTDLICISACMRMYPEFTEVCFRVLFT